MERSQHSPAILPSHKDDKDGDDDGSSSVKSGSDDDKGNGGETGHGKRLLRGVDRARRQTSTDNPFFTPNFDSDDAGFVDTPVLAQFNFTGASYPAASLRAVSSSSRRYRRFFRRTTLFFSIYVARR